MHSFSSEHVPNYYSTNKGASPQMERKETQLSARSLAKNGLTNPRTKRRLDFESDRRLNERIRSRDDAFRDLASVLRGVLELKQQKEKPTKKFRALEEASATQQGKVSSPDNDVVKAKRRLNLPASVGSLQKYGKKRVKEQLGAENIVEGRRSLQKFEEFGIFLGKEQLGAQNLVAGGDSLQRFENIEFFICKEQLDAENFVQGRGSLEKFGKILSKELLGAGNLECKGNRDFKGMGESFVQGTANASVEENLRNFIEDRGVELGNEVCVKSFKKCIRSVEEEHGNGLLGQGLEISTGSLSEGLRFKIKIEGSGEKTNNYGNELVEEAGIEPSDEILKKTNVNMEVFREGLYYTPKIRRNNLKLNNLGYNLVQVLGSELSDKNMRKFNENTSEEAGDGNIDEGFKKCSKISPRENGNTRKGPGDETINQSFKKCRRTLLEERRNEPATQGFEKSCAALGEGLGSEPKVEGNGQIIKDLGKYLVREPVSDPLDRNLKKSNEDRSKEPGNGVVDLIFKKYRRSSAEKRRNEPFGRSFEKPSEAVLEVLATKPKYEKSSQNFPDLDKKLVEGHVNEPVHKKLNKSKKYRSEEPGYEIIGQSFKNFSRSSSKEHGNETASHFLEKSCAALGEGPCSEPKVEGNSQKLRSLGKNLVQEPVNEVLDKHLKECSPGNEVISQIFKKCSRDSVKKQRNGSASHVCKKSSAFLQEGIGMEPKFEGNSQSLKDLGKNLVQEPVNELAEVKKCNGAGNQELKNEVKCSGNSTQKIRNDHVSQGFEKSSAVLGEGPSSGPKIKNFTFSVGQKIGSYLNDNKLVTENKGPYLDFCRPDSEECREIRDQLLELHGFPEEFVKFRERLQQKVGVPSASKQQVLSLHQKNGVENIKAQAKHAKDSCFENMGPEIIPMVVPYEVQETMLDSLICTLLSQNTTDANSRRAFATLKARFPTWNEVHKADPKALEDAIRCGGLAETKASRIRNILDTLMKEQGKTCLEHLRSMPVEKIKAELCRFKGVGSKTVACVLMFHLQQDDFPVDTHVFRITKSLGWVPPEANREKAYLHLNHRIPNDLKFDLNCLLVTHGKHCPSCSKRGRSQQARDGPCPLLKFRVANN